MGGGSDSSMPGPPRVQGAGEHAAQLALVQEALGIITWAWDVADNCVRWFGDVSPMLDLPPGAYNGTFPEFLARLHPDDVAASRERFRLCLKGLAPQYRAEERIVRPDGSIRWLQTFGRGSYGSDGRAVRLVGAIADITERRRAQEVVIASERRLRELIEQAPVAIGISRDDVVVYGNPAFQAMFRVPDAQALARLSVTSLVASRSRDDFRRRTEQRLRGEAADPHYEMSALRCDGTEFECQVSVTDLKLHDGQATLVFVQDITERRRSEREIRELNASLEQRVADRTRQLELSNAALAEALEAAESARHAKGDFLAHMSHEIRTPMNAILGMADLALRAEDLAPRTRDYLGHIRSAGSSLLVIINDVLDFSKIESGKLEIETREFALQEVLDKLTSMVGVGASEKGLEFLLGTAPDVPAHLIGDPTRLGQVLLNLCSNAVKFTEQGEIVVVTVKVESTRTDRVRLRFSVRDTGIGIDSAELARLFQPFEQGDASTSRRFGGTGLGLAICKQLVGLMGGEIGVRSQPGKGSDFHVTLDFGLPLRAAEQEPKESDLAGQRVLVVDDSANAREVMLGLLQALGCVGQAVDSGAEALSLLSSAPWPQVIVIDWKMPGQDGFATARALMAQAAGRGLPPLVMLTAYGDEALARRALQEGFAAYLDKPVTLATLAATLRRVGQRDTAPAAALPAGAQSPVPELAMKRLSGRRILLVEDNELNQMVATDLLGDVAGALVSVAENGAAALQMLAEQTFDLVLMDVQMPVMDGYEATRRLRAVPAWRTLPVVAMTAHAMARDRQLCLAAGMNDFVGKPFEPQELFEVLARHLPPALAPAAAAASASLPETGIDADAAVSWELGLHRCLGRQELHQRILERFLATRSEDADRLQAALREGDALAAERIAHTMVSTAGTIGAEGLSTAARSLQQALQAGDAGRVAPLAAAFVHEHARVMTTLQQRAARPDPTHS